MFANSDDRAKILWKEPHHPCVTAPVHFLTWGKTTGWHFIHYKESHFHINPLHWSWKKRINKEHIHIRINPWSLRNMYMFSSFIWRQQPESSYAGVPQSSCYPILTPFELVISFDHWNNQILGKVVTVFPISSMKIKS